VAASILAALAVIALCATVVFSYLSRNIFDSASFADRAQSAIASDDVRSVAARELTDQIINEVAPDAVAIGPLIETVTGAVIQSDAFGRAFRSSVLQLHSATVRGDTDGAVLTIANVGVLLSGALRHVAPGTAKHIPDDFDAVMLRLANVGVVNDLAKASRQSDRWMKICAGLTLLLTVLAFLVLDRRRRLLRILGGEMLGIGLLLAAGWFLARAWVVHRVGAGGAAEVDAVEQIWDVFMYGLFVDLLLVAAVGAVLGAVADGLLTGVNLERRLEEIGRYLLRVPERLVVRVLWALAVMAVGVTIAFNAEFVAKALVVTLGVLIGARGFQVLVMMIAPPEPEAAADAGGRRPDRRRLIAAASIVGVLLLALVISTHRGGGLEALGIVPNMTACNGSDSLCEKRLNEIAMATTHNSMSAQTSPGFLFPAQETGVRKQLDDGIRGLQIDVYYGFPGTRVYTDDERSSPEARRVMKQEFGEEFVAAADRVRRSLSRPQGVAPQLFLCHGFCELGATKFAEAMADVKSFLRANPREVVAIVFEDHVPWQSLADGLQESGLDDYGYRGPWGGELPKLGEMIASGRRLLLLTENGKPDVPWMHNAYEFFQETPFRFTTVAQLEAKSSCDQKRGSPENPMFLINHWVDTPPNPRPSVARRVNSFGFLWNRVSRCAEERKLHPNMVAVDFYRVGDLFRVVDKLNDVH
jgi:hypothetical protein